MSRIPRTAYDSNLFHITCRGNNKQTIFKDTKDYRKFLKILKKYKEKFLFKLYSYTLMRTHIHLAIESTANFSISKIMQAINLSYSFHFRKKYNYVGHVWQGRFTSSPVGNDCYLLRCLRYIDLNPVKDNIIIDPANHQWGSYRAYAFGEKNALIDLHSIYYLLGTDDKTRQSEYRNFVLSELSEGTLLKIGGETVLI